MHWDAKTERFLSVVRETLDLTLSGECGDEILQGLAVESVVPAPDPGRLLVTVAPTGEEPLDPVVVIDRLNRAKSFLRAAVASAVRRKKVPDLAFAFSPPR